MEKIAQRVKDLIAPIPKDEFITRLFSDGIGKCCVIGHINRLTSTDPKNYKQPLGDLKEGALGGAIRDSSKNFLINTHGIPDNIATVNNYPETNGYTEPEIKDRVMHLLDDMIEADY